MSSAHEERAPRRSAPATPVRLAPTAGPAPVPGSSGRPLPAGVARVVGRGLNVDTSTVRVHDDALANEAAAKRNVSAFTYGSDVYLGRGQRDTDVELIAHEVAHVVQQTGRPALQLFTSVPTSDPLEHEAQAAGAAVARGDTATVAGRTAPREQGGIISWIGDRLEDIENWAIDKLWSLAERLLPATLVKILRKGIFTWLKEQIADAARALFDTLMRPVNAVREFIGNVVDHFRSLVAWMADAVQKLIKGDCSSISDAADKIVKVVEGIGAPIVNRIKEIVGAVGDFFSGLWKNYLSKAWEWLKNLGGAIWDGIKWLADKIWDLTKPIRDLAGRAWRWLKEKIFGSEDSSKGDGEGGLIGWIKDKAEAAWDWVKEKLEPIKKPLAVIGVIVVALSPAGPVIAIAAGVGGLIAGARWIAQKLRDRNSVIRERGYLQGVIIPSIMGVVNAVVAAVTKAANWLAGLFGSAVGGLGSAVSGLAGSILSFLARLIEIILNVFKRLASWAADFVGGLAKAIGAAFDRLRAFLQPLLDVLVALGSVIADLFNIVKLIFTKAWNLIPACIRDPIVNFIRDQILKRIPIFSQLLEIPDIWTKVKETAFKIIRQIFRDGDLAGAALTFFKAVLSILSIPIELVTGIFTKAASALGDIIRSPIRFLRSVLGAAWQGFKQFFGRILKWLLEGVLGWLSGQLKEAAIEVPTEWSFTAIVKLVLSVLGVTVDKIWKLLGAAIGDAVVEKLKKAVKFLTGAWEWVSALITEGPAGLWKKLKEELGQLKEMVIGAIAGYISETIIVQASVKILTALNPVGAIVNAIILAYKAIQTAAQYARQILEMINRVLDVAVDLAAGSIGSAANIIETLLGKALTIAIGFLANYLGLGGFGRKVAEMVKKIQDSVEQALKRIIDWAVKTGKSLLASLGFGGKKDDGTPAGVTVTPVEFDAAGEHHEVFAKDGRVMIASTTPVDIPTYITHLKQRINNVGDTTVKQNLLAQLKPQEDIAGSASAELLAAMGTRPDVRQVSPGPLQAAIVRLAGSLRIITQIASQVAHTGTREDPIPMFWYKQLGIYPAIDIGGVRYFAEDDEVLVAAPPDVEGRGDLLRGNRINLALDPLYHPEATAARSRSQPLQRLGPGMGDIARATAEVRLYRRILAFNNAPAGVLQIDHVHEIGLNGPDIIGNLWPLNAAANRAANATYTQQVLVRTPTGAELARVQDLERRYFVIVGFRSA